MNTWLERSLLVSRLLRSCRRASFLARISSLLVSSPSSSSSPLLCSRTRSISSSNQRFCSSIFYSKGAHKGSHNRQKTRHTDTRTHICESQKSSSDSCLGQCCHTCCSSNEMTEPLLPLRLCLWKAAISSVLILRIFCCCSFFNSSSYRKDMEIIRLNT